MQVNNEIFSFWSRMFDRGDKLKIHEEKGIDPRKVAEAIDNGQASAEDIVLINDFFKEKESKLNQQLNG